MTPSEREEIIKEINKVLDIWDTGFNVTANLLDLIVEVCVTQVEKARAEQREIDAKICDKYTGAVCGCQKMLAEIIRNKLNQKGE